MDARPVLGVPTLRPPLLVDLSAARSREAETSYRARVVTNTLFVHFAWGPTPTLAAGAPSLSPPQGGCHVGSAGASRPSTSSGRGEPFEPRGPQALFTIGFVLDDDPDDDLDDDEFGDDEEGEDEEDEENDDEDPDTETWQVSSFEECPKGWLPLDFGV